MTTASPDPRGAQLRSRLPSVVGVLLLLVGLTACPNSGVTVPSSAAQSAARAAQSGKVDGHYTGMGAYVDGITFDVSGGGTALSAFHGFIMASCSIGGARTQLEQFTMDDPDTIPVDANGHFTATYSVPGVGDGAFTVDGDLDGAGAATGTVKYKNGACASGTNPWSASVQGVRRPQLPTVTPTPSTARDCSPQPCARIAPLLLTIQGFQTATWTAYGATPALVLQFTLTNESNAPIGFSDQLWLNDRTQGPVGPGLGINSVTLSTGEDVTCSHGADLQPGQVLTGLTWCYAPGSLDISQPLRLDWKSVRGQTSLTLDPPT